MSYAILPSEIKYTRNLSIHLLLHSVLRLLLSAIHVHPPVDGAGRHHKCARRGRRWRRRRVVRPVSGGRRRLCTVQYDRCQPGKSNSNRSGLWRRWRYFWKHMGWKSRRRFELRELSHCWRRHQHHI